jgi:hypothetical protein
MCNLDDFIRLHEIYRNALNTLAVQALPIMVCLSASDIASLPLDSLKGHLQGLEPEALLMINIKSINSCDLAVVGQSVTFADNVQITAAEFVHLLDKGDMK